MKKFNKVLLVLPLVLASVFFILPNRTFAFGLGDIMTEMIVTPLREGVTYLVQQGLIGISKFITEPTNLGKVNYLDESIQYAKYIALALLTLNLLKELFKSMVDEGYGQGGKPIDLIIGQAIKAVVFMYSSQWILEDVLIRANNAAIDLVTSIVPNFHALSEDSSMQTADQLTRTLIGTTDSIGIIVMILFFLVILGIGFIVLVIVAGLRLAQLAFLMVIGPILAVSAVDKGEAFNTWIRESVAVVFTQLLQVWLFGFLMNTLLSGGFWDIFQAIGIIAIMVKGPSSIKTFVHSSGAGSALIGNGKAAVYQFMMRQAMAK